MRYPCKMPSLKYSIVVPAYNEAQYLPRLLDSIQTATSQLEDGTEVVEIIVADNQSTDETAAIARSRGCRVVAVERRAIAAARNGGAAAAAGEFLCFVDADTRIHPDTLASIDSRVSSGLYGGGAVGWKLERSSLGLRCTDTVVRVLTWLAGVNGGVVFCRRDIFNEIGGYNENKRYAEDVEFFRSMRKTSKKRGLKTLWKTNTPATISTRKFDRHGDWHMLYMWLWILRNRSMDKTVDNYWYNDSERF